MTSPGIESDAWLTHQFGKNYTEIILDFVLGARSPKPQMAEMLRRFSVHASLGKSHCLPDAPNIVLNEHRNDV